MFHPPAEEAGEQDGALNPPEPEGIPCALKFPAEMSFVTSLLLHLGHVGTNSSVEKTSFSKWLLHFLHTNSNIGIKSPLII